MDGASQLEPPRPVEQGVITAVASKLEKAAPEK
jgi:hypothetical protein